MKLGPLVAAAALAAAAIVRRRRLTPLVLAVTSIAAACLAVYGCGLVHPPSVEVMVRDAASALGPYTYALVGVLAFLETGGGLGLIAPGELAVVLGGVSAGQGELDLATLIALVWGCALAGDLTSYVMGRRLGRGFLIRHGAGVGVSERRVAQVERFFADHGGKTIIVGRFIGLVRVLSPFLAGASKMPARRFALYTAIASGIWAATFSVLGYLFWRSLDELLAFTEQGTLTLALIAALVMAGIALRRRLRPRPVPRG